MFTQTLSYTKQHGFTTHLGLLKSCPKLSQVCLPEMAKNCSTYTTNLPKAAKNELPKGK